MVETFQYSKPVLLSHFVLSFRYPRLAVQIKKNKNKQQPSNRK